MTQPRETSTRARAVRWRRASRRVAFECFNIRLEKDEFLRRTRHNIRCFAIILPASESSRSSRSIINGAISAGNTGSNSAIFCSAKMKAIYTRSMEIRSLPRVVRLTGDEVTPAWPRKEVRRSTAVELQPVAADPTCAHFWKRMSQTEVSMSKLRLSS